MDQLGELMLPLLVGAAVWFGLRPGSERRLVAAPEAPKWLAAVPGAPSPAVRGASAVVLGGGAGLWLLPMLQLATLPVTALVMAGTWWGMGRVSWIDHAARQRQLAWDLPQVCDLLAAMVDAGLPLRRAAEIVVEELSGPLEVVLGEAVAQLRLGVPEPEVWRSVAAEASLADFGRALSRIAQSGSAAGPVLSALASESRRVAANEAMVRSRRVGVRSVLPLMLCFMPAFVLLGIVPLIAGLATGLFG